APRDAMLADLANPTNRGRVYGFHQAMDHVGAVLGPLLATLFLMFHPGRCRMVFALTAIPGALTLLLLCWAQEPRSPNPALRHAQGAPSDESRGVTGKLPPALMRYLVVLSIFTLGNSTDAFLLLRLTDAAGGPKFIPLMWAALHVVKTVASVVGGSASDRFGRRTLIAGGWLAYALVYAGFALSASLAGLVCWFR